MRNLSRGLLSAVLTILIGAGVMFVFFACGSSSSGGGHHKAGPLMIAADRNGDIYTVSKTSGATKPLLDVYNASTFEDIGPITAMAYDPDTGFIYAGTGGGGYVGGVCPGCIFKIDPKTGEAMVALDSASITNTPIHIFDIALYNGLLYFITDDDLLFTVMPTYNSTALGAPTLLNSSADGYEGGMFSDKNDQLYVEDFELRAINSTTGDETVLGDITFPDPAPFEAVYPGFTNATSLGNERILSAAVDPHSMNQYGLLTPGIHGTEPWYLAKMNAPDTDVTYVATNDRFIDGLAFVPSGVIKSNLGQASQPPSNVEAVSAYQSVLLGWNPVFDASSYRVYWASSSGVTPLSYDGMATVTGKTYYADGSAAGDTYYVVTAVRNGKESEASAEVHAAPNANTGAELISYAPETLTVGATAITNLTDDSVTGPIDIGFEFNFFGSTYTQFQMSSNGFVVIGNTPGSDDGCCQGLNIPSDDSDNNVVAFAWGDLYPPGGGTVKYEVLGSAPNRRLVIDVMQDYYQEFGNNLVQSQVILYEGPTGTVDVQSTKVGEFTNLTQGVEDSTGSAAYYVPGRVVNRFGLTNDAVRFITNTP